MSKISDHQPLTFCKGLINDREMFMKGIDYSYYYEEDTPEEN